ncbi:MAG TPA: class I SAM-dependent methyltransferase [Isosphaeraceae bacterium]|nr:class I SAM-dependent methyltransferase [Isosphaeraceae bacterium]
MQADRYHDPARHWDGLHVLERFRPIYPSEAVVRFLLSGFRERLQQGPRLSALDIGVGGGRHTRLLCELGFDTSGVDISAEGLKQTEDLLARLGFQATLKSAAMTELPFESNSFDVVISYGVFYYGTAADMRRAIAEVHRVLKAGGRAFVVVRTTDDFRHGKGQLLEEDTYLLTISETNEEGTVQHFLSEPALRAAFAAFAGLEFEKMEVSFAARTAKNSDWLISVVK